MNQKTIKPLFINEQIILFDASPFLYIHGANPQYKRTLRTHIEAAFENLNSTRYIGIIDGGGNYRKKVAVTAPYKGNRDKSNILEKFPFLYRVKEELINTYGMHLVYGIEADDAVGILNRRINPHQFAYIYDEAGVLVTQEITNYKSIIASIDKDLLQLSAFHYNLTRHDVVLSSQSTSHIELGVKRNKVIGTGYKFLYAQVLMGDSTDNIKGLEKCGPVGAYTILKDCINEAECITATKEAFFLKEQDLTMKEIYKERDRLLGLGIKAKMLVPTDEEIWELALKKYDEMFNLIFILRKNYTLSEIKVSRYKST